MKLTCILMIATFMHAYGTTYAQKVSLNKEKASLQEIFNEIRIQTGYSFIISSNLAKQSVPVSIKVKNVYLKEALDKCFTDQNLTYVINGKTIVVQEADVAIKPANTRAVQRYDIKGTVRDSLGAIPGVSITIKGLKKGTTTDQNGKFIIEVPNDEAVLVFSMIGFETQEIPVKAREIINVVLKESTNSLEDVVVVAFGQQKKSEVVGSVTTINPDELKIPSSNLTTALAGRVSGIIAYQRSGEPGADNADFFIRGVTTFGYKKDPLILIDGIESSSTDLARLQTDDIESFSIMKDATATALYGSRAANGVIIIKTKEGKAGKAVISLRLENSMSMPTRDVELADPITYMKLNNEAVLTRDPLGQLPYSYEKIDNTIAGVNKYMYPATDWHNELIKDNTMNQRANLNVSGGGNVARYYVAGTANQDNGLLKVDPRNNFNNNVKLKTYSLRTNVNINLTPTTELSVRLSGTFDDYNGPISGGAQVYTNIMRTNPVRFPAYYPADAEHQHVQHTMFGNYQNANGGGYLMNPYASLVRGYKESSRSVMSAQFQVSQNLSFLTEGLSIRSMLSTTRNSFFDVTRSYSPFWYQADNYDKSNDTFNLLLLNEEQGTEYLDYNPGTKELQSMFYMESALNYARTFNEKHGLSSMLIFLMQNRLTGNADDLQTSLPFRNVGLAGRMTYSFRERYSAEINFGYNASERFYKNNRWGFFPSAGVAWNVSNERFWKPLKNTITNLKLRATYGLTGNDAIGAPTDRFLYLSSVNMTDAGRGAVFGRDNGYRRSGMSVSRYSDPNISWETSKKSNVALELGLFNQLRIEADFFTEVRSDILQARATIPAEMGLSATPRANIGKAEGKGIDISLDYNHHFSNDFWLQARGNFTYAASKFLVYEELDYQQVQAPWKSRVGYSLNQRWGYLAERLFVDDEEAARAPRQNFGEYGGGDIKYRDVNGDGQITEIDQVSLGFPDVPEIVYGFGFSAGYRNFDFSCFFQGSARSSFWINATQTTPFVDEKQLLKAYADNYWSEENQNLYALWPRLSTTTAGNTNNTQTSSWFMRNGAFIRLKQVEIGYSLPQPILKRAYMKNMRLYLNSSNPFISSKFKLWDVEMGGNGLGYPVQKVFNVGLLMTF